MDIINIFNAYLYFFYYFILFIIPFFIIDFFNKGNKDQDIIRGNVFLHKVNTYKILTLYIKENI